MSGGGDGGVGGGAGSGNGKLDKIRTFHGFLVPYLYRPFISACTFIKTKR